jgi:hypothetical protein
MQKKFPEACKSQGEREHATESLEIVQSPDVAVQKQAHDQEGLRRLHIETHLSGDIE